MTWSTSTPRSTSSSSTSRYAVGAAGARAYAARQGVDLETFVAGLGPTLTPALVGEAIAGLAADPAKNRDAYLLSPAGLRPLD